MGVLQRFYAMLSRGEPADPDELVEVALVRIASGPMTVARLCSEGFHAVGNETFNIVTNVCSDYRILVPRREADGASALLQSFA
ncbi:unannotated protein [freshwater metagenome]|uniref:Unannotated protein n=1 Tax=freshwater metagenome TaxID=449393 RepID=A0A6J7DXV4_9ZZZZ